MTYVPRTQELSSQQTVLRPDMTQESATYRQTAAESVRQLGFIEKGTGKHQSNTVYDKDGLSPTLSACDWKDATKVIECKKINL